MTKEELQQKYEVLILEIISCDPEKFDGIFYEIVDLKCKEFEQLQQENQAYKEAIKRCYTPEEIDFEIMQVKAELEAEKDINNNLHKTIDKLRVNLYETQQERDKYKEVIEEVREYIWSNKFEWGDLEEDNEDFDIDGHEILQILDKVKEN